MSVLSEIGSLLPDNNQIGEETLVKFQHIAICTLLLNFIACGTGVHSVDEPSNLPSSQVSDAPSIATWSQIHPADNPSQRFSHAMAFDGDSILLFGGRDAAGMLIDDTGWQWDGTDWSPVPSASRPNPRIVHTMVHDSVRNRVVLFGGTDGSMLADTWEWDGAIWEDVTPAGLNPSGRSGHAMAFDEARGLVVMYGGFSAQGPEQDLWEWDGSSWLQVTTTGAQPLPRVNHAMAYDAQTQNVLLFGGWNGNFDYFQDTWSWNGSTWDLLEIAGSKPVPRAGHTLAQQPSGLGLVLFGGNIIDTRFDDTWLFDGNTWSQIVTPSVPAGRWGQGFATDPMHDVVVLYGGFTDQAYLDTWEFRYNSGPVLDPIGSQQVDVGRTLAFAVAATDPDGDAIEFSTSDLPTGATFSGESGEFFWQPSNDQVGQYEIEFMAADTANLVDSEIIVVTVGRGSASPGGCTTVAPSGITLLLTFALLLALNPGKKRLFS